MCQALQLLFYFQFLTSWHKMIAVFLSSSNLRRPGVERGAVIHQGPRSPPMGDKIKTKEPPLLCTTAQAVRQQQ